MNWRLCLERLTDAFGTLQGLKGSTYQARDSIPSKFLFNCFFQGCWIESSVRANGNNSYVHQEVFSSSLNSQVCLWIEKQEKNSKGVYAPLAAFWYGKKPKLPRNIFYNIKFTEFSAQTEHFMPKIWWILCYFEAASALFSFQGENLEKFFLRSLQDHRISSFDSFMGMVIIAKRLYSSQFLVTWPFLMPMIILLVL